ncbi:MAG: CHASE domain-containing protein, partial [Thiotrichaceae bacterium]|nr:CHASE domain-containing protein [Thiotrichaceae bacterium]
QFENKATATLHRHFSFVEQNNQGEIISAQQREWYYPIYYTAPLSTNLKVLGFDLGSNPQRLKSLMKSVDTNAPVASLRLKVLQSKQDSSDFLVILAIYKQDSLTATAEQRHHSLQGFAVAVLEIGQMIEAILSRHAGMAGLEIQFMDSDARGGDQLLYLHAPHNADNGLHIDAKGRYQTNETMQFADRKWQIIAKSANSDLYPVWSSGSLQLPMAIFILSGILAFYLRRAGQREIEHNEMLVYQTALLDAMPNPIFVLNEQLEFSSCNKAYEQFFNIKREDYLGKPSSELNYYSDATKHAFSVADLAMENIDGSSHEEISITTQAGLKFDIIYWRTSFSLDDEKSAGMIGILIDITERKQAELALLQSEQRFDL